MRWLIGGLLSLFLLLQYRLWFAEGGLAEASRLSAQLEEAEIENARENLGLIKEGEVYYQFVEEPESP